MNFELVQVETEELEQYKIPTIQEKPSRFLPGFFV